MNYMKKSHFIRIISFLSVACIILSVSTVVYADRARKYKFLTQVSYERAISELCESIDNITVSLQKGTYCSTGKMLSDIGNDLSRQATAAKVSLGQLTSKTQVSEDIYKFLSQIGAFTVAVAKSEDKLKLSKSQKDNLQSLLKYAQSLSKNLGDIRDGVSNGDIVETQSKTTLSETSAGYTKTFDSSMSDVSQSLADYPTLIYDGPFADNVLNKVGGKMLKSLGEITKQEAKKIAAEIMNTNQESLREDHDVYSDIELYCFSKGDVAVAITKKGGKLCYMVNPRDVGEETISSQECIKRAKKFLQDAGYKNMKESYYSVYDGVCTVNFAYTKNSIVHYSDLIKVSVALDNGEVLSVDARGYLTNHTDRDIYQKKLTKAQAQEILSDSLTVISVDSAVIPTDAGKEAYCYEFHCKDKNNQEVLIYIDKLTGEEVDILILLYADGGVLTR